MLSYARVRHVLPSEDLPSLSYAGIIWGIGDNTIVESTTIQHFLGLMQRDGHEALG